ncbi:MAG: mechanosensitive ion channel [Alphaproteobacteria bacterium]
MTARAVARCLPLILVLVVLAGTAAAQSAQKISRPFGTQLTEWNRILDQAQVYLDRTQQVEAETDDWIAKIGQLLLEAHEVANIARADLEKAQELLTALGPEPKEGEPAETDDVRKERDTLNERVAQLRARVTQTELTIARAEQLRGQLGELTLSGFFDDLGRAYPPPFEADTWRDGLAAAYALASETARSALDWRAELAARKRGNVIFARMVLITICVLALGWLLRRVLLRRFGRNADPDPTYTRRFAAAIAEGAARGLIPAALLLTILQRATARSDLFFGPVADYVAAACLGLIVLVLAVSLPRAVLAPSQPVWSLMPIEARSARAMCRWIGLVGFIFALDVALIVAFHDADIVPALRSIYATVTDLLEGAGILLLLRPSLWRLQKRTPGSDVEKVEAAAAAPFWPLLRLLVAIVVVVGMGAILIGHAGLGDYLIKNLVISGLVVGTLFLLRGVLRELVGIGLRARLIREQAGISHRTRRLLKFWLRVLLDLVLVFGGLLLVLPFWGVAWAALSEWATLILTGLRVGNVTLSITDIGTAILVLVVGLIITRLLRRGLAEQLLPETNLDLGVQNSIASGFGYLGVLLAGTLAVAALGIDLSNIALIAGALSVGIGFGLQNVVNNFVSGLILLIERPVKVGDWVVVGGNEGFVKKINVRATELQTFQRASVIIPNADLISSSVMNWTHQDRYGRIEVGVGVAYGSDTARVKEIMLEAANAHERVLDYPAPFVLFMNFGDSSLDFELRCYTDDVLYKIIIASDIRFEIDRRFREADIEIPFPQRVVHIVPPGDGA